ncbi:hypothetical protein FRC04_003244 [Tulasnella sp. 424]|nr:hypothetical protein FRC04_003244 [Tulasnella sp. 424]
MTITTQAPPPGLQLEPTATGGITSLPIEIIYVILDYLSPPEICKLALVSRLFHHFISSYWSHYHTLNPRPSLTLTESIKHHWTPAQLALHNHTSDLSWSNRAGAAQELLQIGKIPPQPVMAIGSNRIFVSTLLKVTMLNLAVKLPPRRPRLDITWPQAVVSGAGDIPEPSSSNRSPNTRRRTAITDVTGMIVPHNDDGPNSTLCIGTADGRVARFHINPSTNAPHTRHRAQSSKPLLQITETARYPHPKCRVNALIQESPAMTSDSTSSSSDLMASLAHHVIPGYRGLVSLYHIKAPWTPPQSLLLPGMPVCGLLSSSATANSPYIAVGTRENTSSNSTTTTLDSHNDEWWTHHPLKHSRHWPKAIYASSPGIAVHPLSPTQLSPDPLALLAPLSRSGTMASSGTSQPPRRKMLNAPYAMCAPSPTAPFGSSSNIILSGWYDSHVLVHDLRVPPTSLSSTSSASPAPLSPVLSFHDRFTDSAVYSLGMGGGSGSHIVAGMASHGVLEIFDARNPRRSWGLYSPGKTSASVYQLHVEGSRIWGLTDRLFVVDMGPEAQGSDITPMLWVHHADSIRPRPDRPARMQSRNFGP